MDCLLCKRMDIILDLGNRIMNFNQTQQQFDEIQQIIENNQELLNDPAKAGSLPETWKIFRVTWHYHKDKNNEKFQKIERYYMQQAPTDPTAATLDKVWAMYFATKDQKYAKCILEATQSPHFQVREAARWSYNSIILGI